MISVLPFSFEFPFQFPGMSAHVGTEGSDSADLQTQPHSSHLLAGSRVKLKCCHLSFRLMMILTDNDSD